MLIQLYGNQVKFDDLSEQTMKYVNRKLELCQVKAISKVGNIIVPKKIQLNIIIS
jgi:hypothetical protein